ncbi:unnamed protein product [Mortierella alpina]
MDPSQEPLLTVCDLFTKARPSQPRLPHPHHSPPAASASASASSSSQPLGRAHSQARVVTFVGQIVHILTNPWPDQKTIAVPQDPLRYPLQRQALRLYQKKCHDLPLDLIIWLAPLGDQAHSPLKAPNTSRVVEASNPAVKQKRQDSNATEDPSVKREDNASTALSWSDSDRSQFSQADSSSDDEDGDAGALMVQPLPNTMVAVLLSQVFDQDKDKDKDKDRNMRWRSLQKRLRSGNIVTVRKAVMLFDEINGTKVVSCVGIPDRTTFKVAPWPHRSSKSKVSISSTSDDRMTSRAAPGLRIGSKKRKPSIDSSSSGQHEDGVPLTPAKRARIKVQAGRQHKDKVAPSTDCVESPNASKQEKATPFEERLSLRKSLVPASTPAPNSLQLLVRRVQEHMFSNLNHGKEKITYFSTLVSNASYRSINSGSSRTTPDLRSRGSSSSNGLNTSRSNSVSSSSSDSHNNYSNNNNDSNSTAGQTAPTRHMCWLRDIRCATLRAMCAECGNSYKNLSCVFGCRSRTWRLGIRMECIVSDGTGQARMVVADDQEDVLWTLLGLDIKTGSASCDLAGPHAISKNTVLATVARRVLWAVDVRRIQPKTEGRMLLSQLRG